MTKPARVTASKYMGNDAYSWAIFVDTRPVLTGLHNSEVAYYKKIEQEKINAHANA